MITPRRIRSAWLVLLAITTILGAGAATGHRDSQNGARGPAQAASRMLRDIPVRDTTIRDTTHRDTLPDTLHRSPPKHPSRPRRPHIARKPAAR